MRTVYRVSYTDAEDEVIKENAKKLLMTPKEYIKMTALMPRRINNLINKERDKWLIKKS